MVGEPLPEGLHFYSPLTTSMTQLSVREEKFEEKTECFTKDTQKVMVTYSMTYFPEPSRIGDLYRQFGFDWSNKIVNQVVLGSIKDVIGQYIADDIVGKREAAKLAAEKEARDNLSKRFVNLTRLDFVNINFDQAYEKAVEDKVVAIQNAARERNRTVEVEEKSKQMVKQAQAEAESLRIKSAALQQSKSLVEMELVKRWDGKLPQYMFGNSVPMIDLSGLRAKATAGN